MKPPAAALPSSSEVAAYVANCFGDMESDIDRIVATALAEAGVPTPDAAAGVAAAAAAAAACPQAAAALPADADAPDGAGAGTGDAEQQPPPVMLRRRLEESVDADDPPADNPVRLPEALGDEPAAPPRALEQNAEHARVMPQPGHTAAGSMQPRSPAVQQPRPSASQPGAARLLKQRPQSAGVAGPHSPIGAPAAVSKFPISLPVKGIMPREAAAMERHVQRRSAASPTRAAAASAAHPHDELTRVGAGRPVGVPRSPTSPGAGAGEPPAFERLYKLGLKRAEERSAPGVPAWLAEAQQNGHGHGRAASAPRARPGSLGGAAERPVFERLYSLGRKRVQQRSEPGAPAWLAEQQSFTRRLSEGEWSQVSMRLYSEAHRRAERQEELQAEAQAEAEARAAAECVRWPDTEPTEGVPESELPRSKKYDRPRSAGQVEYYLYGSDGGSLLHGSFLERREEDLQSRAWKQQQEKDKKLVEWWDNISHTYTKLPAVSKHSCEVALQAWAGGKQRDPRRPWTAAPAVKSPPRPRQRSYSPLEFVRGGSPEDIANAQRLEQILQAREQGMPLPPPPASAAEGQPADGGGWLAPRTATEGSYAAAAAAAMQQGAQPHVAPAWPLPGSGTQQGQAVVPIAPGDGVAFVQISLPPGLVAQAQARAAQPQPGLQRPEQPAAAQYVPQHQAALTMTSAWRAAMGSVPSAGGGLEPTPGAATSADVSAAASPSVSLGGARPFAPAGGAGSPVSRASKLGSSSGGGASSGAAKVAALRTLLGSGVALQPTLSQALQAALVLAEAEEAQEIAAAQAAAAAETAAALQQPGQRHPQAAAGVNYYALQQQQQLRVARQQPPQPHPGGALPKSPSQRARYAAQLADAAIAAAVQQAQRPPAAYFMTTERVQAGSYSQLHRKSGGGARKPVHRTASGREIDSAIVDFLLQQQVKTKQQPQQQPAPASAAAAPPPTQAYSRAQIVSALRQSSAGGEPPPAEAANPFPQPAHAAWVPPALSSMALGELSSEAPPAPAAEAEPQAPGEAEGKSRAGARKARGSGKHASAVESRMLPYELGDSPLASPGARQLGAPPAEEPEREEEGRKEDWEHCLEAAEAGEAHAMRRDLESGQMFEVAGFGAPEPEHAVEELSEPPRRGSSGDGDAASLWEIAVVRSISGSSRGGGGGGGAAGAAPAGGVAFSSWPRISADAGRVASSPRLPESPKAAPAASPDARGLAARPSKLSIAAAAEAVAEDLLVFTPGTAGGNAEAAGQAGQAGGKGEAPADAGAGVDLEALLFDEQLTPQARAARLADAFRRSNSNGLDGALEALAQTVEILKSGELPSVEQPPALDAEGAAKQEQAAAEAVGLADRPVCSAGCGDAWDVVLAAAEERVAAAAAPAASLEEALGLGPSGAAGGRGEAE
ncbi:hypothetical protein Rsub_05084 [Raphidocelis subcapitata]|uniref:Uncharacterized protein n=1 Tax=Raphidocelis subcapitata TaxID=307507 RepID=A0A2V0P6J8_9CHLO|nr:hypothetical protein Rsub_05084 [Raphidocelis subcapitata]|eukprot:GBF92715.1 hypothetical protein Rsub_05084 [Raphidocelis subcapitata]